MKIRVRRFNKNLSLPLSVPRRGSAGLDISCRESVVVEPHSVANVPVNIAVEVPEGYFLLLASRSSTPLSKGLMLANGIGIIDPYSREDDDEISVELYNYTDKSVKVAIGERLTQAILIKHEEIEWNEVESLDNSTNY